MAAFFVAFNTSLTAAQLAGRRRSLTRLLKRKGVEFHTLSMGEGKSITERLTTETRGAALIVVDDDHSEPGKSDWIETLVRQTADLLPARKPQVIYVTERKTAAGLAQYPDHPLVRYYVKRDAKGAWIKEVANYAALIDRQMRATMPLPRAAHSNHDELTGESPCFRESVEELTRIIRLPYGMVSGEPGCGKMFLIQSLWRQIKPVGALVVVPCGSFFKDYYIGGVRRRFGGGREAVEQLVPYLNEAKSGLLVLHHVERLPTALQEELVARLLLSDYKGLKNPVVGLEKCAMVGRDVRVLATSSFPPQILRNRGLIDELAVKFAKRHVHIPSLADRGAVDIELTCHDILRRIVRREMGAARWPGGQLGTGDDWTKHVPQVAPEAMELLRRAHCPNNISDLLGWIEYAWRHCRGGTIRRSHLPPDIAATRRRPAGTLKEVVAVAQRRAIQNALDQTGDDVKEAAAMLGINRGSLHRLIKALGMRDGEGDA